jgi:hypothetical protein
MESACMSIRRTVEKLDTPARLAPLRLQLAVTEGGLGAKPHVYANNSMISGIWRDFWGTPAASAAFTSWLATALVLSWT